MKTRISLLIILFLIFDCIAKEPPVQKAYNEKDKLIHYTLGGSIIPGDISGMNSLRVNENCIEEKYWKLTELYGKKISPGDNQKEQHFILSGKDKRITGYGGCNSFAGTYELKEGNRIKFSRLISTMMMCPDMQNEEQFLKVLEVADNYSLSADTLSLNKARMAPLAKFLAVIPDQSMESDSSRTEKLIFQKELSMKGIRFEIYSVDHTLRIQPVGLMEDNRKVVSEIDGTVTGAEIGDLNNDGFPEIYVFTTSDGSGSYGNVVGYAVNNGKSISEIYIPPITDSEEASEGYMGHDKFSIKDNLLVRSFPVYNKNDTNANPTGGTKIINYQLLKGEAGWRLRIYNFLSY